MPSQMTPTARKRRDRRVAPHPLQQPSMSAFTTMFGSRCESSLITVYGLDHRSFRDLLALFEPMYNRFTPYSTDGSKRRIDPSISQGGPRSMTALQYLALTLTWEIRRGGEYLICMIF